MHVLVASAHQQEQSSTAGSSTDNYQFLLAGTTRFHLEGCYSGGTLVAGNVNTVHFEYEVPVVHILQWQDVANFI